MKNNYLILILLITIPFSCNEKDDPQMMSVIPAMGKQLLNNDGLPLKEYEIRIPYQTLEAKDLDKNNITPWDVYLTTKVADPSQGGNAYLMLDANQDNISATLDSAKQELVLVADSPYSIGSILDIAGKEIPVNTTLTMEDAIFWKKSLKPTNFDRLNGAYYTGTSPIDETVKSTDPSIIRTELVDYYTEMGINSQPFLNIFDKAVQDANDLVRLNFTSPNTGEFCVRLLAGLLALGGTPWEPALETILGNENSLNKPQGVYYDSNVPSGQNILSTTENGRRVIKFIPNLGKCSIESLATYFAHEACHGDETGNKLEEELIANDMEQLVWNYIASKRKKVLGYKTRTATFNNTMALGVLNGGKNSSVGFETPYWANNEYSIFPSNILSGEYGKKTQSYNEFTKYTYTKSGYTQGATPGGYYLNQVLSNLTGQTFTNMNYDQKTLELVDTLPESFLGKDYWIELARELKALPLS